MLLKFGISKDLSCSFCNMEEETTIHIFYVEIQQDFKIINHLLLIFKLFVYKSRDEKYLNFHRLKNKIARVKNIEEQLLTIIQEKFLKKWKKVIKKFN